MSSSLPSRPTPLGHRAGRKIAIIASGYNPEFVEGLVKHACAELAILAPGVEIPIVRVPGSFEIPLAVEMTAIAHRETLDAILAFGVIFEGATRHADLIGTAVTNALMNLGLKHRLPILHEVLIVETAEQARERCLGTEINRGIEAARAAVRMIDALQKLREPQSSEATLLFSTTVRASAQVGH
jgi:6,7-dimethyl-8-ribityllumazine synthase